MSTSNAVHIGEVVPITARTPSRSNSPISSDRSANVMYAHKFHPQALFEMRGR